MREKEQGLLRLRGGISKIFPACFSPAKCTVPCLANTPFPQTYTPVTLEDIMDVIF